MDASVLRNKLKINTKKKALTQATQWSFKSSLNMNVQYDYVINLSFQYND